MVGRELLTMCPDGEDHQGHDWGETGVDTVATVATVRTSRGVGTMMNGSKSLGLKMRMVFCDLTHVMLMTTMAAFIPMNFYLMD